MGVTNWKPFQSNRLKFYSCMYDAFGFDCYTVNYDDIFKYDLEDITMYLYGRCPSCKKWIWKLFYDKESFKYVWIERYSWYSYGFYKDNFDNFLLYVKREYC